MLPRRRTGTRRLDLSVVKKALEDQRVWCGIGVVYQPAGESHYVLVDGDILVEVQLMPRGEHLLCRMGAAAGGQARGVWSIPAPGTEVALMIPGGEFDADPMIVATLSSGGVPDGIDEETIVISTKNGGKVLIIDGQTGEEEPLVRRSEFNSHTHTLTAVPVTNATPAAPGPVFASGTSNSPVSITGTSVLRAK